MTLTKDGKVEFRGTAYDNPLDSEPYPRRMYEEGKESARISYRTLWLDHYERLPSGAVSCHSEKLKMLSNGKVFVGDGEIRDPAELANAREIFDNLKVG